MNDTDEFISSVGISHHYANSAPCRSVGFYPGGDSRVKAHPHLTTSTLRPIFLLYSHASLDLRDIFGSVQGAKWLSETRLAFIK